MFQKLVSCLLLSFIGLYGLSTIAASDQKWTYLHPLSSDTPVEFYLVLKQNSAGVNQLRERVMKISNPESSEYGAYLEIDEIQRMVRPDPKDTKHVVDWMHLQINQMSGYGHQVMIENRGDVLKCQTNAGVVNKLFKAKMWMTTDGIRSSTDYQIPKKLHNVLQFIEGLSNSAPRIQERPIGESRASAGVGSGRVITADSGYIGKEAIGRLYNVPSFKVGWNNVSVGAIEFQGMSGFSENDLMAYQAANNIQNHSIAGGDIRGNVEEPTDESQLDVQMIANADGAELWYWDAPQWLFGFANNLYSSTKTPDVVSMSWGWSTSDQCTISQCGSMDAQQYVDRTDVEFMKLAARGITMISSSGDAGAPGRTAEDCSSINPVFPTSSQWVTSVGATFVVAETGQPTNWNYTTPLCQQDGCVTGTDQLPVSYSVLNWWTSGGGFGIYNNSRPDWQNTSVPAYLESHVHLPPLTNFNANGRGYPDLVTVGHNCATFNGGVVGMVDGTSCSSPIWASLVTLLNWHQVSQGRPKLGYMNPLLYRMWEEYPAAFTDVTQGNNHGTEQQNCQSDMGFLASKGWDAVSGLGTPNVAEMMKYLDSMS